MLEASIKQQCKTKKKLRIGIYSLHKSFHLRLYQTNRNTQVKFRITTKYNSYYIVSCSMYTASMLIFCMQYSDCLLHPTMQSNELYLTFHFQFDKQSSRKSPWLIVVVVVLDCKELTFFFFWQISLKNAICIFIFKVMDNWMSLAKLNMKHNEVMYQQCSILLFEACSIFRKQ